MGETSQVAQDPTSIEGLAPTFTPPKRTSAPPPEYPPRLRASGVEGDVGLHVEIDASGHVAHVTVSAPSDHDEFNHAAEAAANASTYEPAKINGVAVARAIDFTVRFRLHS
jgi:TonB family protein